MGYSPDDLRDINVLIYPISDDLGHYHNDTLAALNEKVRSQLVSQQGMRGIIDDLRRRVQPTDLVLITSDHGFQELFPEDAVTISAAKLYKQERRRKTSPIGISGLRPPRDWEVGEIRRRSLGGAGLGQEAGHSLHVAGRGHAGIRERRASRRGSPTAVFRWRRWSSRAF